MILVSLIYTTNIIIVFTGSNGPQKFCIERVGKDTWLPRSHTWYVVKTVINTLSVSCLLLIFIQFLFLQF